jgi:hypothetical protein
MHTYLSTDWLEVDSTMVKVVLTDESEAYLISVTNANGKPEAELFKLDAKYLYDNRHDFFNAVMDAWGEAEKMPIERAFEMKLLNPSELNEVISKF